MRNWFPARQPFATSTRPCASLGVALLVAALCACSSSPRQATQSSSRPRIWDVGAARFVSEAKLVDDVAHARYRLLGEIHDDPLHHAIRARLIREIASSGARPAVVFEQFDLDHDDALQAAQHAGADAEQLADAGALDRKGWQWPLHEPIVAAARAARLPIRAGNLSRADLDRAVEGPAPEATSAWQARLRAAPWTEADARALRDEIVESHCGMLPDTIVPRLVRAQRMRDAAMAQALVDDATNDGAILIAGNGHVRGDRGVPIYLHAPGLQADARSVSVGLIEVGPGREGAADDPQRIAADHPGFDYLWFTPVVPRADPCAGFHAP